jgi:hypothetical protein
LEFSCRHVSSPGLRGRKVGRLIFRNGRWCVSSLAYRARRNDVAVVRGGKGAVVTFLHRGGWRLISASHRWGLRPDAGWRACVQVRACPCCGRNRTCAGGGVRRDGLMRGRKVHSG